MVGNLKIDRGIPSQLDRVTDVARGHEQAGYDGCWTGEINHDPFLPLLLAAEHTTSIDLGTSIAVAFARNPMTLANLGWDLQTYSRGRFIIGLGTQVQAHIEKRFGMARGIGYATAKALLARGARVVIGDRDIPVLEAAVATLASAGLVTGHPLDVSDRDSFAMFLDRARADGGGHIDVLINNAGVMPVGPLLEQSEQTIRTAIEVNFYGVLTGSRLVLPEMVARRSGHIVNIASLAGVVPVPGQVLYAGTKFAVVGLSTAMADEFAVHGIEVSVVMPPFTATELIAGAKGTGTSRPVSPAVIAAAVARVLDKPKTHVAVPYPMRFISPLLSMLGPRSRRSLNRRMGSDRLFLDFDTEARRAYEQRATTATGVVDGSAQD